MRTRKESLEHLLVKRLSRTDGSRHMRPVHATGTGVSGHFVASKVAHGYCIAQHFVDRAKHPEQKIKVTVRFSNGSGCKHRHDSWSDVRGMATRFHLPDGTDTDLVAMTLPVFFTPDPKSFLDFAIAATPKPVRRESPWRKFLDLLRLTLPMRDPYVGETKSPDKGAIEYADAHAFAQPAVFEAAAIGAPTSYTRAAYHAVHTFIVTGPDQTRRWVRFSWQPIYGVLVTEPKPKSAMPDEYLHAEMATRLAKGPARFSLMMTIGEAGDDFDDPSRAWPPHRVRVMMGTLVLDRMIEDQDAGCEKLSFNPWLLTEGISASDDKVLLARKEAYAFSSKRRGGADYPVPLTEPSGD